MLYKRYIIGMLFLLWIWKNYIGLRKRKCNELVGFAKGKESLALLHAHTFHIVVESCKTSVFLSGNYCIFGFTFVVLLFNSP